MEVGHRGVKVEDWDNKKELTQIPLKKSDPVVSYKVTVSEKSPYKYDR